MDQSRDPPANRAGCETQSQLEPVPVMLPCLLPATASATQREARLLYNLRERVSRHTPTLLCGDMMELELSAGEIAET